VARRRPAARPPDTPRPGAPRSPFCYADFTGDRGPDLFEFFTFVNVFNSSNPAADCDEDGSLTLFDFLCFSNTFNAGC
jgi:hypothetical protein